MASLALTALVPVGSPGKAGVDADAGALEPPIATTAGTGLEPEEKSRARCDAEGELHWRTIAGERWIPPPRAHIKSQSNKNGKPWQKETYTKLQTAVLAIGDGKWPGSRPVRRWARAG